MRTETLLTAYHVDRGHARYVADLALALFDHTGALHGMSKSARSMLETGALLHNVGMTVDEAQHHIVGRDIVLRDDLDTFDDDTRAIIACIVAFHRKKVRPNLEPTYLRLSKKRQDVALRLAAILRVADGLDYSQSQMTRLLGCTSDGARFVLHLAGPHAASDGARALAKADLWQKTLGGQLEVVVEEEPPVADAGAARAEPPATPEGPEADAGPVESSALPPALGAGLAEAGRVILRRHFRRLLVEERAVRADSDIEAVHGLRVATRRLRSTLQLLEPVAPVREVQRFRKAIQRIAQSAGATRDCDVFLAQIERYVAEQPDERRAGVEPIVAALQIDRTVAHARLVERLDTARYADFKRAFAIFITDNAAGWNTAPRPRDLAGSVLWRRYEQLRVHEIGLDLRDAEANNDAALHEMRIDGKRLRYTLEAIAEATEQSLAAVLDPLIELQDHLGAIQDIAVASAYVRALEEHREDNAELEAYLASRIAERARLLETLPQVWETITGADYRRALMDVIIGL